MPFKKGEVSNPKGKPAGTKSRKTVEWEKLGDFITDAGAKRVANYLNSLEDDKEFFEKYERLLNYFKPKQQSTQVKNEGELSINVNPKKWVK